MCPNFWVNPKVCYIDFQKNPIMFQFWKCCRIRIFQHCVLQEVFPEFWWIRLKIKRIVKNARRQFFSIFWSQAWIKVKDFHSRKSLRALLHTDIPFFQGNCQLRRIFSLSMMTSSLLRWSNHHVVKEKKSKFRRPWQLSRKFKVASGFWSENRGTFTKKKSQYICRKSFYSLVSLKSKK